MALVFVFIVGLLVGPAMPASGSTRWWTPTVDITWDIQFGVDADARLVLPDEPIAAIDLDGAETRAETITSLRRRDIRTICYVNVGAWESWRPDAGDFPQGILGNDYPGWPGERFVDIRALDMLGPIIEKRFDECAGKGFDAIEPDNIDTAFTDSGFSLTREDQLAFNHWLADAAHKRGLAIFQKNVPELTAELVEVYDGAITEDCAADRWCREMTPYRAHGKPVLAIEYTDVTDKEAFAVICNEPVVNGLSLILKNRDLDTFRLSCDTLAGTDTD